MPVATVEELDGLADPFRIAFEGAGHAGPTTHHLNKPGSVVEVTDPAGATGRLDAPAGWRPQQRPGAVARFQACLVALDIDSPVSAWLGITSKVMEVIWPEAPPCLFSFLSK